MVAALMYAVAAGALSAFNPCGFVLLPTYAASFLAEGGSVSQGRRVASVSAAMSAGFFTVFAVAGVLVGAAGLAVPAQLPSRLVLAVAFLMAVSGVAVYSGRNLPGLRLTAGSTRDAYSYGVAYASASLACTLPVFLSAVVFAFAREGGFVSGMSAALGFGFGMSSAVLATLLTVAYAGSDAVSRLRSSGRFPRLAGALLIAGAALLVARELAGFTLLDAAASAVQDSPALVVVPGAAVALWAASRHYLLRTGREGR